MSNDDYHERMRHRGDEFFQRKREKDEKIRQWDADKDREDEHWALLRSLGLQGRTIVKDGNGNVIFDGFTMSPAEEARREAERTAGAGKSYIETKIQQVYQDLQAEGLTPTDELIAARLPVGPKGQNYTRETVNRKRNKMRKRGIEV